MAGTNPIAPTWIGENALVPKDLAKTLYTAPELMRLTGMTRKQVSYWSKTGLVVPAFHDALARTGKPAHFYTAAEVIKALVVCELRRAGFAPRQLQQVARNLEDHGIGINGPEVYLLTDGYSVYYAVSDDEVVDVLKHHRQMLLLVPIHDQIAKLQEAA